MDFDKLSKITSLAELKASGYQSKRVKDEIRDNLINKIRNKDSRFAGIHGFDETVIPDLERALLSRHNLILLGLRGQAKTRIARQIIDLLDPLIPALEGTELLEDPFNPISRQAKDLLAEAGDDAAIRWVAASERYAEKLATPDVSVADLIGDVDPIKAANLKLPYSDERVIHYGLVPRAHRGLFVINELPDLQPRIQVALFNILQEGDVQIRGFNLRLPLDIQFIFTANPEDYTNRGSIVTPLKDRIESQILTHYPKDINISRTITAQEARHTEAQRDKVQLHPIALDLVEQIAIEARASEYVDEKSGVSARMTITARENLVSAAERRILLNGEESSMIRMGDFWGLIPSITGKIELVYEGEQEGPYLVAINLLGKAVRSLFASHFPNPEELKNQKEIKDPYQPVSDWFGEGAELDLFHDMDQKSYRKALDEVPGLDDIVDKYHPKISKEERYFLKEFVLHGLAEYSMLSKQILEGGNRFGDLLSSMLSSDSIDEEIY